MKIKLNEVFSNPSLFLVTGFGIGLLPIAPVYSYKVISI